MALLPSAGSSIVRRISSDENVGFWWHGGTHTWFFWLKVDPQDLSYAPIEHFDELAQGPDASHAY